MPSDHLTQRVANLLVHSTHLIIVLLFTDGLGQRATIHQVSWNTIPEEFQGKIYIPPGIMQTFEEALNGSRRYRTTICNA